MGVHPIVYLVYGVPVNSDDIDRIGMLVIPELYGEDWSDDEERTSNGMYYFDNGVDFWLSKYVHKFDINYIEDPDHLSKQVDLTLTEEEKDDLDLESNNIDVGYHTIVRYV